MEDELIKSTIIIEALKDKYPKINRASVCIARSNDYGACFCKDALKILKRKGINLTETNQPKKRKPRKQIVLNLNDSEERLIDLRIQSLGVSKQDYIKQLIDNDILKEFK